VFRRKKMMKVWMGLNKIEGDLGAVKKKKKTQHLTGTRTPWIIS
jgi:hypothetical protein